MPPRNSAVFLAVLSPNYLARKQSMTELQAFARGSNAAQRILVVEPLPTELDSLPAALRDRKAFRFYQMDRDMGMPARLQPGPQSRAYVDTMERLVSELARLLRAIRSAELNKVLHDPPAEPEPANVPMERESFDTSAFDVFISYARQNKPAADAACAMLEAAGIRCWIAPRDILPGIDWGEAIIEAIAGAKIMVVIFSRHANGSQQIKREVERAVHKGIPIITVRMEDTPLSRSLEYYLSTPHWLDALTPPTRGAFEAAGCRLQGAAEIRILQLKS